jgi:hypothetical protein
MSEPMDGAELKRAAKQTRKSQLLNSLKRFNDWCERQWFIRLSREVALWFGIWKLWELNFWMWSQ